MASFNAMLQFLLPSSMACPRNASRWLLRLLLLISLFYVSRLIWDYMLLHKYIHTRNEHTVDNTNKRYHNGIIGANKIEDAVKKSSIVKSIDQRASTKIINLECMSSANEVYLLVNGVKVYHYISSFQDGRGIHLIVLNQYNGDVMVKKVFDTFASGYELYMVEYLSTIRDNMILVFLIKDEASLGLKKVGRDALTLLGSRSIKQLGWRDMWGFVSKKGKGWLSEGHTKSSGGHGKSVTIMSTIRLDSIENSCGWGSSLAEKKRAQFCFKYIGYQSLCDCSKPSPIRFKSTVLLGNRLISVPISIIASNRPHYLYKMLSILLQTPGVQKDMVTVYIDGFHDEPAAVANLLDVKFVEHVHVCSVDVCRIHQHYKYTLDNTFKMYPDAEYMVILEEDLEVAEDIMDYFSQMLPLLAFDESIYCLSAWNDNAYKYSCNDPAMVYRIEGMPGLGWVLKRKLYFQELQPAWPDLTYFGDWDLWMRLPQIRKGRECIVPDISRTFHFGKLGLHVNSYVSGVYNQSLITALNKQNGNVFDTRKLTKRGYEEEVNGLIKDAQLLDHTLNPCNDTNFVPSSKNRVYVLYIKWAYKGDTETWLNLAECLHLWHEDVRSFHKLMWRFWMKGNQIFVIGSKSPYVVHKPKHITPFHLSDEMMHKRRKFDMGLRQGYKI